MSKELTSSQLLDISIYYITYILSTVYVVLSSIIHYIVDKIYERQAKQRRWNGLSSLPPYKHQSYKNLNKLQKQQKHNNINNNHNSSTATTSSESRYWSLQNCPVEERTYVTEDNISIKYYIIYPGNKKTFAICNGLGVSKNYCGFAPLVHRYGTIGGDYTFITWDYRGLFDSGADTLDKPRKLAIHYQIQDLYGILKQEHIDRVDVLVGFSLGVQVALEFTLIYPEIVDKVLLCNGTHGNVLQTIYQPLYRIPYADYIMYKGTEIIANNTWLFRATFIPTRLTVLLIGYMYSILLGSPFLRELLGSDYIIQFFDEYIGGVITSPQHTENYMRLVLEMNAHSVYHHLHEIKQPVLILSGLLDPLTPCYLSYEMARKLPNVKHVNVKLSSHFTLLEQPRQALRAIIEFIENVKFKDIDNKSFVIDDEYNNKLQQNSSRTVQPANGTSKRI